MTTAEDIQSWIQAGMQVERIDVQGDGAHFEAVIVSSEFQGKNTLARHRIVYTALGDKMKEAIHALSMKTLTPVEAEQNTGE